MDNQDLISTIATLAKSIDPLIVANRTDAVTIVVDKIIELVEKIQ